VRVARGGSGSNRTAGGNQSQNYVRLRRELESKIFNHQGHEVSRSKSRS
jgi:hypothetical protein